VAVQPRVALPERRHWPLRLLWLACAITVAIASLLPDTSEPLQLLAELPVSDKALHFTAYAILAFVPSVHERLFPAVLQLAASFGLGIGLEFVQEYFSRSYEAADMVADGWGLIFGLVLGLILRQYLDGRKRRALVGR